MTRKVIAGGAAGLAVVAFYSTLVALLWWVNQEEKPEPVW